MRSDRGGGGLTYPQGSSVSRQLRVRTSFANSALVGVSKTPLHSTDTYATDHVQLSQSSAGVAVSCWTWCTLSSITDQLVRSPCATPLATSPQLQRTTVIPSLRGIRRKIARESARVHKKKPVCRNVASVPSRAYRCVACTCYDRRCVERLLLDGCDCR